MPARDSEDSEFVIPLEVINLMEDDDTPLIHLERTTTPLETPKKRASGAQLYGQIQTRIACTHCQAGYSTLRDGRMCMCVACDGTGFKGGHGPNKPPIPDAVFQRYTHRDEIKKEED